MVLFEIIYNIFFFLLFQWCKSGTCVSKKSLAPLEASAAIRPPIINLTKNLQQSNLVDDKKYSNLKQEFNLNGVIR